MQGTRGTQKLPPASWQCYLTSTIPKHTIRGKEKCCTKGNICPASKLIRLYFVYMQVIDIFKIHCFGAQRRALWEIFAWVVLKNSGQALNETWSTQPPTLLSSDNHCSCIWIYRAGHSWFNQFTNSQYTSKVDGLVISYHFPSYEK